jgi:hypothetical protein
MPSATPTNKGGATATAAAQTQAQQATTPPSKPAPTVLRAVQTKQTPLAQAARHATPALLAGLFALRFSALVADPVATMASSLPLAAALQAGYAVLCLPVAGSAAAAAGGGGGSGGGGGGAKTGRKVKPVLRPGEGGGLRRRVGGGAGDGGAVVVSFFFSFSFRFFSTTLPFLVEVVYWDTWLT